jgi:hypothetical protein
MKRKNLNFQGSQREVLVNDSFNANKLMRRLKQNMIPSLIAVQNFLRERLKL